MGIIRRSGVAAQIGIAVPETVSFSVAVMSCSRTTASPAILSQPTKKKADAPLGYLLFGIYYAI